MTYKPDKDLQRAHQGGRYLGNPEVDIVDETGIVLGPLAPGRWTLHSKTVCYWKRGDSTMTVADVLVDVTTPSTSMPFAANEYIEIDVNDNTEDYVAFKLASGGTDGLVFAMPKVPLGS